MQTGLQPAERGEYRGSSSSRPSFAVCSSLLALVFLLASSETIDAQQIFADSFESGTIEAWSRSSGADCDVVLSQVDNCDFDLGLDGWFISSGDIATAVMDDSDGGPGQAIELLVTSSISFARCSPKTIAGPAFLNRMIDMKLVSGSLIDCAMTTRRYSDEACTMLVGGSSFDDFLPTEPEWRTRVLGGTLATADIQSIRVTVKCRGDAVVRFDEIVQTPLDVLVP